MKVKTSKDMFNLIFQYLNNILYFLSYNSPVEDCCGQREKKEERRRRRRAFSFIIF